MTFATTNTATHHFLVSNAFKTTELINNIIIIIIAHAITHGCLGFVRNFFFLLYYYYYNNDVVEHKRTAASSMLLAVVPCVLNDT